MWRYSNFGLDCEQSLFCAKIRRENARGRKNAKHHERASVICEAVSSAGVVASNVTLMVTLIFRMDFRAKRDYSHAVYARQNITMI